MPEIPDFSRFTVWPHLIRLSEERALVGVIGPNEPDYKEEIQIPGGSFSRRDLYLFVVDLDDKSSSLVQLLPYSTRASIRGCMNEADARRREANCMDEYRYDATVKALAGAQPYPDLQVTTQATRAPAGDAAARLRRIPRGPAPQRLSRRRRVQTAPAWTRAPAALRLSPRSRDCAGPAGATGRARPARPCGPDPLATPPPRAPAPRAE